MIKIGILGATGYTGLELLKILARHPAADVVWLTSEGSASSCFGDVFSYPLPYADMTLLSAAEVDLAAANVIFACLPHGASQGAVASARRAGARVVDLSADYRLHDAAGYETWYGKPHSEPAYLAEAVYGLPELHRSQIEAASLVANPGCYPTSVILALAPLARAGWLSGTLIVDSKSGVSGAGRQPSLKTHFVEANENVSPYSIGRTHRHLAEMEQEVREQGAPGGPAPAWHLIFSPHLVPANRGIVSTIYVTLPAPVGEEQVRAAFAGIYQDEPFVRLLPPGQLATMAHSVNTNYCTLGLTYVAESRTLIVTSSIDNLIKGASGQAVQNMNLMFDLDETCALR